MNNLFSVYDSCSGIFGDPFVAVNENVAKRAFVNSLSHPSVPKYIRDDSVLYCIGCYDNQTGYVSYDSAPYVVCRGSTVVPDVPCDVSVDKEVVPLED